MGEVSIWGESQSAVISKRLQNGKKTTSIYGSLKFRAVLAASGNILGVLSTSLQKFKLCILLEYATSIGSA